MKMLLDGQWVDRPKKIEVTDPYDDSLIDTVPKSQPEDAQKAIEAAVEGFENIKKLTAYERSQILFKTADIVSENSKAFAEMIAREGSKTIREARREVSRCINILTVSAEEAKRIMGETIPFDSFLGGETRKGFYYRFPIGVFLAITPYNDPLNLVAHKLGPAIAAGNSVILKPATLTPLSALKLAKALLEAGLPPRALQVITGYGSEIGDTMVKDERIRMVSFTGSVEAGRRIAELGGLKKKAMELGSNSAVIVWKDADIAHSVESCVSGAFWAAGQNCIGVQRIYIHKNLYNEFKREFVKKVSQYQTGHKLDEQTDMGPMISEKEAKRVELWINEAVEKGATILIGGKRKKALLEPTVLENVDKTAKIHWDESFGPTVNLYPTESLEDTIKENNELKYGLHAAIFTQDMDIAFKAAYELECGGVLINDSTDYRLDSMPFGGVKYSGLGREGIKFAMQEMTETKIICFNLPARYT